MSVFSRKFGPASGDRSTSGSLSFKPLFEALEDRVVPVSNVLPGTELAGQNYESATQSGTNIPPMPEGAVGVDFLVSVANNSILWRQKDGGGEVVEISMTTFFENGVGSPLAPIINLRTGTPIVDSNGNDVFEFDPAPRGVGGLGTQNIAATSLAISSTGGYIEPFSAPQEARILYDQYLGRFVVVASTQTNSVTANQIYVAVSRTENPNDGWNLLSINGAFLMDVDISAQADTFRPHYTDDIQVGMTQNAIVITGNMIQDGPPGPNGSIRPDQARDNVVFAIQKQGFYEDIITTVEITSTDRGSFRQMGTGQAHLNLTPTHNYGQDLNTMFFVEMSPDSPFTFSNQATIFAFDTTGVFGFVSLEATITGLSAPPNTATTYDLPGFAAAPGINNGVVAIDPNTFGDTGSTVEFNTATNTDNFNIPGGTNTPGGAVVATSAVWRDTAAVADGVGSLWIAHTLTNSTTGLLEVRWYEIETDLNDFFAPFDILQQGSVDTSSIDGTNIETYSPSITVNRFNDMAIAFAASSADLFIGAYYAGRFQEDINLAQYNTANGAITREAKALQEGLDVYLRAIQFSVPAPWGPWSTVTVDPTDDETFWTFNAYADIRPADQPFGFWNTTWGSFVSVADTLIIVVDVSESMESIAGLDVNGDGILSRLDDRNDDLNYGTVLDLAIFQVEQLIESGVLPGLQGEFGNVALIIFGRNARPVEVNLNPGPFGSELVVDPGSDNTNNGIADFTEAVRSIRVGQAGLLSETQVDPTRSFYQAAIDEIFNVRDLTTPFGGGVSQAIIYSDGAGALPSNPNIPQGIRIDTVALGPYQFVGPIGDFLLISAATGGANNVFTAPEITVFSDEGLANILAQVPPAAPPPPEPPVIETPVTPEVPADPTDSDEEPEAPLDEETETPGTPEEEETERPEGSGNEIETDPLEDPLADPETATV